MASHENRTFAFVLYLEAIQSQPFIYILDAEYIALAYIFDVFGTIEY
jgi:hypothetical protein